ncbi:MAG: hypothetical protein SGILL_000052 [Bacillariaceae sp.]
MVRTVIVPLNGGDVVNSSFQQIEPNNGDGDFPFRTPPQHQGVVHYHHYHHHPHHDQRPSGVDNIPISPETIVEGQELRLQEQPEHVGNEEDDDDNSALFNRHKTGRFSETSGTFASLALSLHAAYAVPNDIGADGVVVDGGYEEKIQKAHYPGEATVNKAMKAKSPMHDLYTYKEHIFIVTLGLILSFNSGFSNGVCLSGFLTPNDERWDAQSTSGMTGAYTVGALALADTLVFSKDSGKSDSNYQGLSSFQFFGFQVVMVLSMICGSTISALLNPRPVPWRIAPMYAPTLLIGAILVCIAAALSSSVEELNQGIGPSHSFFFFVAAANGVQNGVSSMYTANLIRTTHLTGTSTDIGLFLGQWLRGNSKNVWKLWILIGLAVAFWLGGFVSFFAVKAWTSNTLFFNAGIFLLIFALQITFLVRNLHISPLRAIRGTWHWQRTLHQLNFRSNMDGTPSSFEILKEAFDEMDDDNNGYIDSDKLYLGLQKAGLNLKIPKSTVDLMFEVADRDKDGFINFEEFKDLVQGQHVLIG